MPVSLASIPALRLLPPVYLSACINGKDPPLPHSPVGHASFFGDGVTPHVKANAYNRAGDEDDENHKSADEQIQEGVKERAARGKWEVGKREEKGIITRKQRLPKQSNQT